MWFIVKVIDMCLIYGECEIEFDIFYCGDFGVVDLCLMERVLDNLVNNVLCYLI